MATNNEDFTEFERQLAALSPQSSSVDRAELIFRAGQESVQPNRSTAGKVAWLWPLSTVAMTLVSLGLTCQLYVQAEPTVIERVQIVEREKTAEPTFVTVDHQLTTNDQHSLENEMPQPLGPSHYLRYRELALATGMDAWSTPIAGDSFESNVGASYRDMRVTYTTLTSTEATDDTASEATKDESDLGDKS